RSTEGIQPPYAVDVQVSYRIGEPVVPTYLVTEDSGSRRDQSEANRTSGAEIEVFTPLIYTLRRIDNPGGLAPEGNGANGEYCIPECECASGIVSMSPAKRAPAAPVTTKIAQGSDDCDCTPAASAASTSQSANATTPGSVPSRADRRALYLGFISKLLG